MSNQPDTDSPGDTPADLRARLEHWDPVTVAVIGLGYVGLPLALKAAYKGHTVFGLDLNSRIIESLKEKRGTLSGLPMHWLHESIDSGRLKPTLVSGDGSLSESDAKLLAGTEVFVICVHTPLAEVDPEEPKNPEARNRPDITPIRNAVRLIENVFAHEARHGGAPAERLLILESTTYPGTTREVFGPLLERFRRSGTRIYVAYSPERSNPAPKLWNEKEEDIEHFRVQRVLGSWDVESEMVAKAFYQWRKLFKEVLEPVSSLEAAELVKLTENTFRFVSIAFAIEMSEVARRLGLDIWEILEAVKTKGFGLDLCTPGLIGGHCIPIDPLYLEWYARNQIDSKYEMTLVQQAQAKHDAYREAAFHLIERFIQRGRPNVVHFFGVTYKPDVADTRESAVKDLMKQLASIGVRVSYTDPVLEANDLAREFMVELTQREYEGISAHRANTVRKAPAENAGGAYGFLLPTNVLLDDWQPSADYTCLVVAVKHASFGATLFRKLVEDDKPAIVDLCNAIGPELKLGPPDYREALLARRRNSYFVLGTLP